jgi:hypothetical protein
MRGLGLGLACAGLFLATVGSAAAALPRATADRPDDISGLQVHMIYAVAADAVDHGYDTDGSIQNAVDIFQQWLAGQTGGRVLRMDTYQGSVDVTFRRIGALDGQEQPSPQYPLFGLTDDLTQAGLVAPTKVYGVYYDGGSAAVPCGNANWPQWPLPSPSTVAAFYLHSMGGGCNHGFPAAGDPPNYTVFAMFHDVMHTLGMVGTCARHPTPANPGHVDDSPTDLMYGGTQPWSPSVLDIGHDDYYQAGIPGCADLDTVGFLSRATTSPLTVSLAGNGDGSVKSIPWPLLSCPPACSSAYVDGTVVALQADPIEDSTFAGWGGSCGGTDTCFVTLDQARNVTATFQAPARTIFASINGTGAGTISSTPAGLHCPSTCEPDFPNRTVVKLAAVAAPGSRFTGWSDDCSGLLSCELKLDGDKVVEAAFKDVQAPRARALASHGRLHGTASLRYRVTENTRNARVVVRVSGPVRIAQAAVSSHFHRVTPGTVYALRWKVPRRLTAKHLRFCVQALDHAGLAGRRSCASLTLR